jgi:pimeloyl-ACP methyl ester carboxylesterase
MPTPVRAPDRLMGSATSPALPERSRADYPTPRWSTRELLGPARSGLRLVRPETVRRLREQWASAGTTPPPFRSVRLLAGAATDEMALGFARLVGMAGSADQLPRIEAETGAALAYYGERGWLADPVRLHPAPPAADPAITSLRAVGADWQLLRWKSTYRPESDEPGAERWLGYERNGVAFARVLRHPDPRPWIVMVHGAFMGWLQTDARVFDAVRLHRELGLNVALPVLPLHGARRPEGGLIPRSLPTIDALDNVHGLAQAAADVRALLGWIRGQDDSPVALYGVSLGSYVAALVAALEPPLDCLIAGIPAVDFPQVFRSQTPQRVRQTPWFTRFMDALSALHVVVSPMLAIPQTAQERRFIYAGRGDRILRPLQQAAELWRWWEEPEIHWFDSGHVTHVRSPDIRRFVERALRQTGLIDS